MDEMNAIQKSNLDIGAETVEINKAEYSVRGLGYIKKGIRPGRAVVTVRDGIPVKIKDLAFVTLGPATRRVVSTKKGWKPWVAWW
jgi:Cu(I)/Ag(I) efflux system membrane protein CusA/SilA